MRNTEENIRALLRDSVPVALRADDFRYSELAEFARLSMTKETELTLIIGDALTSEEIRRLAHIGRGHLRVDISHG